MCECDLTLFLGSYTTSFTVSPVVSETLGTVHTAAAW